MPETPENRPSIIRLENISFSYPGSNNKVLDGLNLDIKAKDRIGMMAPNGSGKTTLLHTIMGLCKPEHGVIEVLGSPMETQRDFTRIRTKVGLLFQDSDDQLFCPTVLDDVAFGPLNLGYSRQQAIDASRKILKDLGIEEFEQSVTHRLSGGQKRLVALAAVLAMSPAILLLDEPTAGLDAAVKQKLVYILNHLDITYFVISHEFDFLNAVTDKVFSMENGRILTDDEIHIHRHEHIHKHGKHPHVHK
ncbi:MAG: energy-coupling factor ABC transporter ATP-binding protein [Proteobacteria bacterium]|nr:energy-coupling factor ABC transporter ATP-binding protein [Pseudomonadota bacterium]MBU4133371.1 energy-coupling factor ABC transporter ATP-binding protein [Pseudomonadota bacterium]